MGSSVLAPLLALACYGMGYRSTIEPFMKVIISFSYLRFGVVGLSVALFGKREPLECDELYCHYRNPEVSYSDIFTIFYGVLIDMFCLKIRCC